MKSAAVRRWFIRIMLTSICLTGFIVFVLFPVAASFLITNGHFKFPEHGPKTPDAVGLSVTNVQFKSDDGISLRGWWNPGDISKPIIIFVHGLNRSRIEMLERAAEANRRGFGILLFDLRSHGESDRAHTTIGIFESHDVCAASLFVRQKADRRSQILWGVSMGASSAVLAAKRCPGFAAIISDSSFLSFRETIGDHLRLFFHLPVFPIANIIVTITRLRVGFDPDDGDVEAAIRSLNIPILFIAGGADRRMPPTVAERLFEASPNPIKQLVVIPGAGHGEAFTKDRTTYLNSVYTFLGRLRYNPCFACPTGGS